MRVRVFLPVALLGAALIVAAPADAQSLPPQPPENAERVSLEWDQVRANWLTECTWNQSRGNRSRSEAREYCEAYLANRSSYAPSYQQPSEVVPVISESDDSSYAEPSGGNRRPVAAKRSVARPGQDRMEMAWRKRCASILGQGDASASPAPNQR